MNAGGGHEFAEALIFEAGGPELVAGHRAGDAFHVHRDEDLERPLRRGGEREDQEQQEGSHLAMWRISVDSTCCCRGMLGDETHPVHGEPIYMMDDKGTFRIVAWL